MIDDRLRDAIAAHDPGTGTGPSWDDIERGAARVASSRRRRRIGAAALASAAAVAVVALTVGGLVGDDGEGVEIVADEPATTTTTEVTTTTSTSTSTTTSTTLAPVVSADPASVDGIYPDRTAYDRDGEAAYADPGMTATAFAKDYLGMASPVVSPAAGPGQRWTLRPNPRASVATTLELAQVGEGGPWTVTSAATAGIVVASPTRLAPVASPLTVRGSARAFEGHVDVQVRQDGMGKDASLGRTFVTGGGDQLVPFHGEVAFEAPSEGAGAVVFTEPSAEDGSTLAATVVRIRFGTASQPEALGPDSLLRFDGVGPITYGMSVQEAKAAARIPMRESALPACVGLEPTNEPAGLDLLAPHAEGVQHALVEDGTIRTAEGVGIGTPEQEVLRAYPDAEVRNAGMDSSRIIRWGAGDHAAFAMVFELDRGIVVAFRSGPREAANADELCS